jgi:hypothetical protein
VGLATVQGNGRPIPIGSRRSCGFAHWAFGQVSRLEFGQGAAHAVHDHSTVRRTSRFPQGRSGPALSELLLPSVEDSDLV